jgi:hypothetical protein
MTDNDTDLAYALDEARRALVGEPSKMGVVPPRVALAQMRASSMRMRLKTLSSSSEGAHLAQSEFSKLRHQVNALITAGLLALGGECVIVPSKVKGSRDEDCPMCQAAIGRPCRSASGQPLTRVHRVRRQAATRKDEP